MVKNIYLNFLVLLLSLAGFDTLAFKPLGGYINHEKLTNSICVGSLRLIDYRFDAVIFFEDNNIPDSVLFEFGDSKSSFVKLKNVEFLCQGLWKCSYETIYQYFYCGTFIVNVRIDTSTFFSAKNLKVNSPFLLEKYINLSALTMIDASNNLFTTGLVDYYPGLRLSVPIETESFDSLHFSINSKFTTIPPNSISINAETGDVLIKQLPDTGLFLFTIEAREFPESGLLNNIHYINLNVRNRNFTHNLTHQDSLKMDGFGVFKSNLKPGDSLSYEMYFNAKTIDSLTVDLKTKIPFYKEPQIEILNLIDSIKVKATFYMDIVNYKILPQSVLFHFTLYEQGNCSNNYSSFYFAPENYKPSGLGKSKVKREPFLYPNPTNGLLNLDSEHYFFKLSNMTIFDISGNKMTYQYKNDQLDITDLPPGIYSVFINHEDNYYTQKIIKQ